MHSQLLQNLLQSLLQSYNRDAENIMTPSSGIIVYLACQVVCYGRVRDRTHWV